MRFQIQKYEKYLESKKDLKMPQGPLNKEFEQFKFFKFV